MTIERDFLPQPWFARAVPCERAGHICDNGIALGRRVHKVDDRFLDAGMRRNTTREPPARGHMGRTVNGHAPRRPNAPVSRNGHVDKRAPAIMASMVNGES
jgi:hypothetical protein